MVKINFGEPFRFEYIKNYIKQTDIAYHDWHTWRIDREVEYILKQEMKKLIVALGSDSKAL